MKKLFGFPLLFVTGFALSQVTNKLESTGNVGIGTVSPVYPLEVVKNANGAAFVSLSNNTNGGDAYAGYSVSSYNQSINLIALSNAHSRSYPGFHSGAVQLLSRAYNGLNIISTKGIDDVGPNTGSIRFITSPNEVSSIAAGNDAYTRMVITPSGNIGVGTLNPASRVDFGSSVANQKLIIGTYVNGNYWSGIGMDSESAGIRIAGDIVGDKPIADFGSYSNDINHDWRSKVRIMGSGKVGIGTSTPSEMLSVNGNVKAKKIIVSTNWSDYVFNDDYQLMPLQQVALFIKANKHLPDIPSAKEVEEKGISVGDNQALLLKKIEELTLYMLEINAKLEKVEKENKQLQKQLSSFTKAE
jgi:uncharacterized protein YaiE (UPF0345 family)